MGGEKLKPDKSILIVFCFHLEIFCPHSNFKMKKKNKKQKKKENNKSTKLQ